MKSSLYACIQDIQNGDREQALALLEKFSPLLKKSSINFFQLIRLYGGLL